MTVTITVDEQSIPVEVTEMPLIGDEIVLNVDITRSKEEQYFGMELPRFVVVRERQWIFCHERAR